MSLVRLRGNAHNRACRSRSIARTVASEDFERAYNLASSGARIVIVAIVERLDKDALDQWILDQREPSDLSGWSLRELRAEGQRLGIRNYNNLPKALLISEIASATSQLAETPQLAGRHAAPFIVSWD